MRHQTATRRLKVREKLHDYKIEDALVRFEQFERKMETVEGRVEAYDLGLKKDLSNQFTSLESEEQVEAELVQLKQRISEGNNAS
jgi:phage shock protein A